LRTLGAILISASTLVGADAFATSVWETCDPSLPTLTERHGKKKAKVELETQQQNEILDWAKEASSQELTERWGNPTQYEGWQIWRGSRMNRTWLWDIFKTDEEKWCYNFSPGAIHPLIEQRDKRPDTRHVRWVVG